MELTTPALSEHPAIVSYNAAAVLVLWGEEHAALTGVHDLLRWVSFWKVRTWGSGYPMSEEAETELHLVTRVGYPMVRKASVFLPPPHP